jgi:hypothetical protein
MIPLFGALYILNNGPIHLAYNPSYSACFFNQNSIFLSQKISQQCFQPAYNSSRTGPMLNTGASPSQVFYSCKQILVQNPARSCKFDKFTSVEPTLFYFLVTCNSKKNS